MNSFRRSNCRRAEGGDNACTLRSVIGPLRNRNRHSKTERVGLPTCKEETADWTSKTRSVGKGVSSPGTQRDVTSCVTSRPECSGVLCRQRISQRHLPNQNGTNVLKTSSVGRSSLGHDVTWDDVTSSSFQGDVKSRSLTALRICAANASLSWLETRAEREL